MSKTLLLFIFFVIRSVAAQASSEPALLEIDLANNRVAMSVGGESVRINDVFVLDQDAGRQCNFRLAAIKEGFAVAEIEECAFKNELRIGATLRKSLFSGFSEVGSKPAVLVKNASATTADISTVTGSLPETEARVERLPRKGWAFTALYSAADEMKSNGTFSAQSDVFDISENINESAPTTSAIGFGLLYHRMRAYGWGFAWGGTYELKREFNDELVFTPFDNDDNPRPYMYLLTLLANATLNLNDFFFLFAGPNYLIPFVGNHEGRMDITGLPGYQAGLGFDLNAHLQLEIGYRLVRSSFKGSEQGDGVTVGIDAENRISGFQGNLKFFF